MTRHNLEIPKAVLLLKAAPLAALLLHGTAAFQGALGWLVVSVGTEATTAVGCSKSAVASRSECDL